MKTGDPIRFDADGRLLDGQHRLLAIVASGIPLKGVQVIRNMETDVFKVIDSGLQRTNADSLGFGVAGATNKAAIARVLWVLEGGADPRDSRDLAIPDRVDIGDYYRLYESEMDAALRVGSNIRGQFRSANASAWGAFVVLAWRIDQDVTNDFIDHVRTGADMGAGDPRLALRNWMANDRQLRNAGEHLALYIKTWNAWLAGESRQVASIRPDEPFPSMLSVKDYPLRRQALEANA